MGAEGGSYWNRRRASRRTLVAAGGAALSAAMLACGKKSSNGGSAASFTSAREAAQAPVQPGGTLNVYQNFNPMLDPQKQSSVGFQGSGGVMQRLFRFKTGANPSVGLNHELEPELALSAESPDAITWTVKLRPNVSFHKIAPVNGRPFEADDVKASFLRILDPATGAPNRGQMGMIDPNGIQTPDKQTVVFKLAYPYAPLRTTLASPAYAMIFPREANAGGYDPLKQSIGTGPFTLDSITPDVAYIYKKNPNYYEKGMPTVDQVKVAILTDDQTQLAQFTAHNLDELQLTANTNLAAAQQNNPSATVIKISNAGPSPIYFQMGDPTGPFLDIRLRRAVSMAIDRDAMGKALYRGDYQSVVYVPASVGRWAIDIKDLPPDTGQYYKYNPSEVKKLLDAAGATNQQFRFVRLTNGPFNSASRQQEAETVSAMLNQAGIKNSIVVHDYFKDFVDAGKGSRQGYYDKDMMVFFYTSSYNDADEWLFSYFHSKSTSNQEHLNDPQLDAMIDKQRTLTNDDERLKAVRDIQLYIAGKMYAPSTAGSFNWRMVQPRVQSYDYSQSSAVMEESYAKVWLKA